MTVETTERTIRLRADVLASKGETTMDVRLDLTARSSVPDLMAHRVPYFYVPRREAYYWTLEWQRDEAEALREVERGESRVFFDPKEAVRWLRSDGD